MAIDARKHTVPEGTDPVDLVGIVGDLSASIRDVIQVDNTTARQAVIDALTAAGEGPSATNPVYVHRSDAGPGSELEVTTDGSTWYSFVSSRAGAVPRVSGTTTIASVAAGATLNVPVTFPAGLFAAAPVVKPSSESSRLTPAAVSRTTTGCTLQFSNWTSAASAAGVVVMWTAEAVA